MPQYTTTPHLLYNHVLGEIESGRDAAALFLLAGMLDAAATEPAHVEQWRRVLLAHPLYKFITKPGVQGGAMAELGFARGLVARVELGRNAIEAAWKRGRRILLFQCGENGELDGLKGHELGNISFESHDIAPVASHYDSIFATSLADQLSHQQLVTLIEQAKIRLKPGGSIFLSSFVPGHLGGVLHQICAGRSLQFHDESDLVAASAAAGCSISHFRDASNGLIWAELRVAGATSHIKGDQK